MTKEAYTKRWLWSGILLVSFMVLVGGITRLTGSGLSMVEWKPVTGIIPPLNEDAWQHEFNKYKQYPEFQKVNAHFALEQFKQIYFWEYLHRLLGRLTGIVFLFPFIFFYAKGWLTPRLFRQLIMVMMIGIAQGFMGWYMVKSGLDKVPHVSHFRLAAHQGLAFLLIGILYWLTLTLQPAEEKSKTAVSLRVLTMSLFFCLVVQCTLGAFVAGLKAGFSYNNFPWMGNSFLPPTSLWQSSGLLYNGVVLQFFHRWIGILIVLGVIFLFYRTRSTPLSKTVKLLLMVVWLQATLGVLTLVFQVPIYLGVIHQATAIVLILILTKLTYVQFQSGSSQEF